MPSGVEPESKDSAPASSGDRPIVVIKADTAQELIEHPADVCECGHLRSLHGYLREGGKYGSACTVRRDGNNGGFEDSCLEFELSKTALAAAVETARVCTGENNAHRPYAVGVTDDGVCPLCTDLALNKRRSFMVPKELCDDCGHYVDLHEDDGCTSTVGCDCMVGALVPEPQVEEPPVLYSPEPLKAYRITYVVSGGQAYEMDVPGDCSVIAEDGMLKIVHPQRTVIAIQAISMFPTLEPRGD